VCAVGLRSCLSSKRSFGQGEEKGEVFVTAGADGRVLQWSLLRGLEHTEIMLAKRVAKDSSAKCVCVCVCVCVRVCVDPEFPLHRCLSPTPPLSDFSGEVLHKGNAKAAFMARTATLMSIDFLPDDHNMYECVCVCVCMCVCVRVRVCVRVCGVSFEYFRA
jgi:hypothetical protein